MNYFVTLAIVLFIYMTLWFIISLFKKRNDIADVAWGLWILALSVPYGWCAVVGPITITFLILKISGIPMLEKKMSEKPDFA